MGHSQGKSGWIGKLQGQQLSVGDSMQYDGQQWAEMYTGHNNPKQKMYELARSDHKTVNRCFNALAACLIYTGIHCISTELCSML